MSLQSVAGTCALGLALLISSVTAGADGPDVVHALYGWQQASARASQPSIERDLAGDADQLSAHELEAAVELSGPVSARELIQRYEWTATGSEGGKVTLKAVPRDELGRLFFSAVEIEFAAGADQPSELRFHDAANRVHSIAVPIPRIAGAIQQAAAVTTAGAGVQQASFVAVEDEEAESSSTPSIDEVLSAWKSATQKIERADIEFARYEYDRASFVENRNEGRLHFDATGGSVYELRTAEFNSGPRSTRTGPNGERYSLTAFTPRIVVWKEHSIVLANPHSKTYDEWRTPNRNEIRRVDFVDAGVLGQGMYAFTAPHRALPATVDLDTDEFLEQFAWSVLKHDSQQITLSGRPLSEQEQAEYSRIDVILDRDTHLARATRLIAPQGNIETVCVIKRFAINEDASQDGWEPDLSGYEGVKR